jgi:hypothetical protein
LLIVAASIAAAGHTSQTHKTGAANKRRIISALPKRSCGDKRFAARKFLGRAAAASSSQRSFGSALGGRRAHPASCLSSRQPFPMMEPSWLVGFIPDGRGLRRRGKNTFEEVRTDVSFRSS